MEGKAAANDRSKIKQILSRLGSDLNIVKEEQLQRAIRRAGKVSYISTNIANIIVSQKGIAAGFSIRCLLMITLHRTRKPVKCGIAGLLNGISIPLRLLDGKMELPRLGFGVQAKVRFIND